MWFEYFDWQTFPEGDHTVAHSDGCYETRGIPDLYSKEWNKNMEQ